jgi:hypothetical protein
MSYQSVLVERKERVGIIILNRPDQFNTFNTALAQELCKALLELEMDGRSGRRHQRRRQGLLHRHRHLRVPRQDPSRVP